MFAVQPAQTTPDLPTKVCLPHTHTHTHTHLRTAQIHTNIFAHSVRSIVVPPGQINGQ